MSAEIVGKILPHHALPTRTLGLRTTSAKPVRRRNYVIHVTRGRTWSFHLPSRLRIGGVGRARKESYYFSSKSHLMRRHDLREVVTKLSKSIAGGSLAQIYFSTAFANLKSPCFLK